MRGLGKVGTGALLGALVLAVAVPLATSPAATAATVTKGKVGAAHIHLTTSTKPSADDTTTDDTTTPPSNQAAKVTFWVGAQQVTNLAKVPAGSALKIKSVPKGSTVELYNFKDHAESFDVAQTKKASLWKSAQLPPATRVQVKVIAPDASQAAVNFSTQAAENTFNVTVAPDGGRWGTGMPLVLDLGVAIPDKDKADVESALKVTSTNDFGDASWHWISSSEVVFRPRDYWPGNSKITVTGDLRRYQAEDGSWGPRIDSSFHTGDANLLKVNLRKHTMDFYRNGKLINQFPISGGMPGHETASGIKVIETKERNRWLTNPAPVGGWHVQVAYAMRVTDDAEFIHTATWNYNLGYANTSHGCTNMSLSGSAWVYRNVLIGDPVEYTGSNVRMSTSNYLSGYWNYSWKDWKAGSALAANNS